MHVYRTSKQQRIMTGPNNDIVFYHYSFSPYARRVTWYMALRGIDYAECIQPPTMPRPDIHALGVAYRRIPVMAIGRDVYCDTRLMLHKLEQIFPDGALGASNADQQAIERLLERWAVETLFARASQLIPSDMPLLEDPKFKSDRQDLTGRSWEKNAVDAARPEAVAHIRAAFAFLESTLLADGRDWVLKTDKPSLADIEAVWPFHWLNGLKGALPREVVSKDQFPRVFAWIDRFDSAIKTARASVPKPTRLKGDVATQRVFKGKVSPDVTFDQKDPSGLSKGQLVEVWPIDSGSNYRDRGHLLGINDEEIVVEVVKENTDKSVHLHVPRTNYRLRAMKGREEAKL